MTPHLTLDNFSLSEDFRSKVLEYQYLTPRDKLDNKLDALEYYNGMKRGESDSFTKSDANILKCRSEIRQLFEERSVTLTPTIPTMRKLCKLLRHNAECPFEQRRHFREDFKKDSYAYLLTPSGCSRPIYIRNSAGIVTRYEHPFHKLPTVRLSLHPCIWAVQHTFVPLLNTELLITTLPPLISRFISCLRFMFSLIRLPVDFFYDGCALGDFPHRRLPYSPRELGVPELSTAPSSSSSPKRPLDEAESIQSNSSTGSEYGGPYRYPEDVDTWVTVLKETPLDDICLERYAKEPSVAYENAIAKGDAWRLVKPVKSIVDDPRIYKKRRVCRAG